MIDTNLLIQAINARQGNKGIAELFGKKSNEQTGTAQQPQSAMAGQGIGGSIQQIMPMIQSIISRIGGGA